MWNEMIDKVQYPDEKEYIIWDGMPYDEVIKFFQHGILITKGEVKKGFQESLVELERRWAERQEKATRKNIAASTKKKREVVYPNRSL